MTRKPETDAEMAALRVSGTVTPLNAQVYLAPYDPTWPAQYAGEAAKIRTALGDAALVLEHVGSTSIPGLAAKPILDILLAVADSGDEDPGQALRAFRGDDVCRFRRPSPSLWGTSRKARQHR